ncbi:MAG TPA: hypothetical protein VG734_11045 [Lacunisphaera sp.]|nr:hypothetical protein [Lacunisphaera sp.]
MPHSVPDSIAIEARAKILWGEPIEKVREYLMGKNVGEKDAGALLEELMAERAASIRSDGFGKIWAGAASVAAPVAYYFATHVWIGYWNHKLFAALVVLAAVGVIKLVSGISMVIRPGAVRGDLSGAADM